LDAPMTWDDMRAIGTEFGSGAVIVLDETVNVVTAAMKIDEFFKHESCGKCTPCREGTHFLVKVWERIEHGHGRASDIPLLDDLGDQMLGGKCFCLLGPSSVSAVKSALKYFKDEIHQQIESGQPLSGQRHTQLEVSDAEGATATGTAPALVR
jgi:NADH-quinone oxidoreductase subunit F